MRTLRSLFALQLQTQAGPGIDSSSAPGVFSLVADSSPVAKVILVILLMLSIVSWGIFLYKFWTFRRAARQSALSQKRMGAAHSSAGFI